MYLSRNMFPVAPISGSWNRSRIHEHSKDHVDEKDDDEHPNAIYLETENQAFDGSGQTGITEEPDHDQYAPDDRDDHDRGFCRFLDRRAELRPGHAPPQGEQEDDHCADRT